MFSNGKNEITMKELCKINSENYEKELAELEEEKENRNLPFLYEKPKKMDFSNLRGEIMEKEMVYLENLKK